MAEKPEADKFTHTAVGYEAISKHEGQACGICAHYIPARPPRCEGVKSPISMRGWCRRFKPK